MSRTTNGVVIPIAKVIESPQISVGFSRTLEIPRDLASGMKISLQIEGIGTIKGKVFETIVPEDFTGNLCYKAWGTIFDASGGACK